MKHIQFLMTFLFIWTNIFAQINECAQGSLKERVIFKEINSDTTRRFYEVEIESKTYLLELLFYSLNDSLLSKYVSKHDSETMEAVDNYILNSHNNQGRIVLTKEGKQIFSKLIDKSILRDSVPSDFLNACTIWKLRFKGIENNKIQFTSFFGDSTGSVGFPVNYMIGLNEGTIEFCFPELEEY